jgi:putative Holliday junction resolvase
MTVTKRYLGVDYGDRRVGLATGDDEVRLAAPLSTLEVEPDELVEALVHVCRKETIDHLVLGLPRGLESQDTAQTVKVRNLAIKLESALGLPITLQDEALTSEVARGRLIDSGQSTTGGAIDREAAAIILQDYLDGLV